MGTPQSYQLLVNHPDYEGVNNARIYVYNSNIFSIYDDVLKYVEIVNATYKINNLVGVGDSSSKIIELPQNRIKIVNRVNGESIFYLYFRNIAEDDLSPLLFYVANGVIVKIVYVYCDDV
jgi:hypothetical protein